MTALDRRLLSDNTEDGSDGMLRVGGCSVAEVAAEYGTPVFVYDEQHLRDRCREAVAAFGHDRVIYATKAFLCRAMAKLAYDEGMLLDVASGGELHVALAAGVPASACTLHGNNKSSAERCQAIEAGVKHVIVDSFDEFEDGSEQVSPASRLRCGWTCRRSGESGRNQLCEFGFRRDPPEHLDDRRERHALLAEWRACSRQDPCLDRSDELPQQGRLADPGGTRHHREAGVGLRGATKVRAQRRELLFAADETTHTWSLCHRLSIAPGRPRSAGISRRNRESPRCAIALLRRNVEPCNHADDSGGTTGDSHAHPASSHPTSRLPNFLGTAMLPRRFAARSVMRCAPA